MADGMTTPIATDERVPKARNKPAQARSRLADRAGTLLKGISETDLTPEVRGALLGMLDEAKRRAKLASKQRR